MDLIIQFYFKRQDVNMKYIFLPLLGLVHQHIQCSEIWSKYSACELPFLPSNAGTTAELKWLPSSL